MTTDVGYGLVRQREFECDGPVEIDIQLGSGTVEVRLGNGRPADDEVIDADGSVAATVDATADEVDVDADLGATADVSATDVDAAADVDGTADMRDSAYPGATTDDLDDTATNMDDATTGTDRTITDATGQDGTGPARIVVEVRYEPREGAEFGLTGLLNWVSGQFGGSGRQYAEQAVDETTIDVQGNRLLVHGPRHSPLRGVPLAIVVSAPAGSSVHTRSGSADVQVSGTAGTAHLDTGSGDLSVERAEGAVQVKSGSGTVRLGTMLDGLSARTGSGDVEVSALSGSGSLHSGSGDIWLGIVSGRKVTVRTGSGDLAVADAAEGQLELSTGSGDLRVGIRSGTVAELDVLSGSGRTRSDLPVSDGPPPGADAPQLRLRARTGSGEVVIGSAKA
jgi:hypothetical protein